MNSLKSNSIVSPHKIHENKPSQGELNVFGIPEPYLLGTQLIDYTEVSKVHVVLQSVPLQITTETYATLLRSDFLTNTTD